MRKIAVLAVFIFSYAYVAPLKAEKNEIADARIAAKTDAQADAKHNAKNDINQFFCCVGSSTLVTISAIGCAFFGCWLGNALDPPHQLDPSVDPEGMFFSWNSLYSGSIRLFRRVGDWFYRVGLWNI